MITDLVKVFVWAFVCEANFTRMRLLWDTVLDSIAVTQSVILFFTYFTNNCYPPPFFSFACNIAAYFDVKEKKKKKKKRKEKKAYVSSRIYSLSAPGRMFFCFWSLSLLIENFSVRKSFPFAKIAFAVVISLVVVVVVVVSLIMLSLFLFTMILLMGQ